MKSLSAIAVATLSVSLLGCGQGNERLAEKARIEGGEQAVAGISATNADLATKAKQMETDLSARHTFYQAVKGTYEGDLGTEKGIFKVRLTFVPSLSPLPVTRTRQLDEITADLNNLHLNAQIVQWNPANRLSAVGCRVEGIRPDMMRGEISIASANCPNLYKLRITDSEVRISLTSETKTPYDSEVSKTTADWVKSGRISELSELKGEVHPTTNASIYSLNAKRTANP